MKIGSLVYATDQGLGILAKAFYDHGVVTDVLVVGHSRHPDHLEWYPSAGAGGNSFVHISNVSHNTTARDFCARMDAMLFFETPFDWHLIDFCRTNRVTTFLMPMHECTPDPIPAEPDHWFFPSLLDAQVFLPGGYPGSPFSFARSADGRRGFFTPVPVDVPWNLRREAKVFVHNAGHGGLRGRNGTKELLEALPLVKSPARVIIRSQTRMYAPQFDEVDSAGNDGERWGGSGRIGNCRVTYWGGTCPSDQLWHEGDAFVFPEKFNGLSLPLQEARAAGMLVMCGDRFPMNQWLPTEADCEDCDGGGMDGRPLGNAGNCQGCGGSGKAKILIPVKEYRKNRVGATYAEFDEAVIDPKDIAAKIDEWYGRDITRYSLGGREWAHLNSWEVLGPQYKALIRDLVRD